MKKIFTFFILGLVIVACQDHEDELISIVDVHLSTNRSMAKSVQITVEIDRSRTLVMSYNPVGKEQEVLIANANDQITNLTHIFSIHRLKEATSYEFQIVSKDQVIYEGTFETLSRPEAVDEFYDELDNQVNTGLDGQLLFHRTGHPSVVMMVDQAGQLSWYRTSTNKIKVANLTHRNTLLTIESASDQPYADGDIILETTLEGDTLLFLPLGFNDFTKVPHHDIMLNAQHHVVFLTQVSQGNFSGDGIMELDRKGNLIWEWDTFSAFPDPVIETYEQPWGNSLVEKDGSYFVSFRRLSQVWKVSKKNGLVDWKLGKNGNIAVSGDTEFLYQHFAHFVNDHELLLFDNGDRNKRQYSRVLSIDLSDTNHPIPKSNITLPAAYFSPFMGSVQKLTSHQYLVCSATNGVILSISDDGNVIWQIEAKDRMYRCVYIEDLFTNED